MSDELDDGDVIEIPRPSEQASQVATDRSRGRNQDSEHIDVAPYELMSISTIIDRESPRWVVRRIIRRGENVVVFGDPSVGKTFVVVDLALCVAAGISWWDYPVAQGGVLYLAGEGVGGLGKRIRAWGINHPEVNIRALDMCVLPHAVAVIDDGAFKRLLKTVKAIEPSPTLIIVDTLARYMVGGDENSAMDAGRFMDRCASLGSASNATVLIIHHKKKGAAAERGSSAIRGAADVMLEVTHAAELTKVFGSKAKDAELMKPLYLQRKVEWLGVDVDGEPVSSLALLRGEAPPLEEPADDDKSFTDPGPPVDYGKKIRETLATLFAGRAAGGPLSKAAGIKKTAYYDSLAAEVAAKRIETIGTSRYPIYALTRRAPEYVAPQGATGGSSSPSSGEFLNSPPESGQESPSEAREFESESVGTRKGAPDDELGLPALSAEGRAKQKKKRRSSL